MELYLMDRLKCALWRIVWIKHIRLFEFSTKPKIIIMKKCLQIIFSLIFFNFQLGAQDYDITTFGNSTGNVIIVCKTGDLTQEPIFFLVDNLSNSNPLNYTWTITGTNAPEITPIGSTGNGIDDPNGSIPAFALPMIIGAELNSMPAEGGPWNLVVNFDDGVNEMVFNYEIRLDFVPTISTILASRRTLETFNGATKAVICDNGQSVLLEAQLSNNSLLATAATFNWDSPSTTDISTGRQISANEIGIYTVRAKNACGEEEAQREVVQGFFAETTDEPQDFVGCQGSDAVFSGSVSASNLSADPYVEFTWTRLTPGSSTSFIIPSSMITNTGNSGGPKTTDATLTNVGDGGLYPDGTRISLSVNNNGCSSFIGSGLVSAIPESPEFVDQEALMEAIVEVNESVTFEKVMKKASGSNTQIQWTLSTDEQTVILEQETMDGVTPITPNDGTVSGTLTDFGPNDKSVEWEITTNPDNDLDGVFTTSLNLVHPDDMVPTSDFDLNLTVINVDDTGTSCGDGATTNAAPITFLPIELLYFTANPKGDGVLLKWATASELNNDYFSVERSIDGRTFEPIGTLPGAGTTQEEQFYSYQDRNINIPATVLYYRLKQTDFNDQFSYSEVVAISFEEDLSIDQTLVIFPNPVQDNFFFKSTIDIAYPTLVNIYDAYGQLIKQGTQSDNQVDIQELEAGLYVLEVVSEHKKRRRRFLKAK